MEVSRKKERERCVENEISILVQKEKENIPYNTAKKVLY
jgi:hypothetical protein